MIERLGSRPFQVTKTCSAAVAGAVSLDPGFISPRFDGAAMRVGRPCAIAAALLTALVWSSREVRPLAHPRASALTWSGDVRPILQRRCIACHDAGGAEPLLSEYAGAREHARRIASVVLARQMPPWQAVPGFGDFANDPSLTADEIDVLVSWTHGGRLEGDEPDGGERSPVAFAASRTAMVVAAPELATPIVSARQVYRQQVKFPADHHVRGWEFSPGNAAHVSSATIRIGDEVVGVWLPGDRRLDWPDGIGIAISPSSAVTMDVTYREPREPAVDRSQVVFYLGAGAFRPVRHLTLRHGFTRLSGDVELLQLRPSVGSGQSVRVVAEDDQAGPQPLLWVRDYDPARPVSYRLRAPAPLPRGSRLRVWSFDGEASVDALYVAAKSPRASVRGAAAEAAAGHRQLTSADPGGRAGIDARPPAGSARIARAAGQDGR